MKTVRITELKRAINNYLEKSFLEDQERIDAAIIFGFILTDTGAYRGFTFKPDEEDIYAGIYGKQGKVRFV